MVEPAAGAQLPTWVEARLEAVGVLSAAEAGLGEDEGLDPEDDEGLDLEAEADAEIGPEEGVAVAIPPTDAVADATATGVPLDV
jgi:hypothetical protein